MPDFIDLHMHTTCSDGKKTPAEVLALVRESGITAFSVTDHDTLEGYRAILPMLQPEDPELIPGIELAATIGSHDAHILAYLFDPDDRVFNDVIYSFRDQRTARARQMVAKLSELGLEVPFEEVEQAAGPGVIGRPHIAVAMAAVGVVRSYDEAFRKYIHNDGPAYVPKARMTPKEVIDLVHSAGGIAVLAHPFLDDMHTHVEELAGLGLDGVEIYHYMHKKAEIKRAAEMARTYNLVVSGGSDFHGRENHSGSIGFARVPADLLEHLKSRARDRRGTH